MAQKRTTAGRLVLRKGEGQRSNGQYYYRWTDPTGERHMIYSKSLTVLREREKEIERDQNDGIKFEAMYLTINDVYKLWKDVKRGLKNNTFENYKYMYETFVAPTFGKERISDIRKTDVKRFYNMLADDRKLKASTIDSVHTVLYQVFQLAVDDSYIRMNPADKALTELKRSHLYKSEKKRALTAQEQELLLSFLKKAKYLHWYPVFAVLLGTGMRVGKRRHSDGRMLTLRRGSSTSITPSSTTTIGRTDTRRAATSISIPRKRRPEKDSFPCLALSRKHSSWKRNTRGRRSWSAGP